MQPPAVPNRPSKHGEASAGTVVLIGASIRSAAQSAKRAGFRVLGIDHFGDVDTRQACQEFWILKEFQTKPALIRRLQKFPHFVVGGLNTEPDATLLLRPATETAKENPTKEADPFSARALEKTDFGRWNDPHWLEKLSKECGLSFPSIFHTLPTNAEPPRSPSKRWLLKTENSCGGLGVRWHTPSSPIATATSGLEPILASSGNLNSKIEPSLKTTTQGEAHRTRHEIFQEWVPGRPHGATLICNGQDCSLLGVCRSLFTHLGDLPFVYRGSFGPVRLPKHLQQRLQMLGLRITRETGHRGLLNIDLVINRSGEAFALEVNPRWSGSSELIERWMQDRKQIDSLFGAMFEASNGLPVAGLNPQVHQPPDSVQSPWSSGPQFLKRIIFARQRFRFSQDLLPFPTKAWEDGCYQSTFSDLPAEGTWISPGEPICTLISQIPEATAAKSPGLGKEKGPMHQHRAFLRHFFESTQT